MSGILSILRKRDGGSIVARLVVGLGVLSAILTAFVALVVSSGWTAYGQMLRAEQSFRQLETARGIEVAFSRYLMAEVQRRLTGAQPIETPEATALREALLQYHRRIGEEIASSDSASERQSEQSELVRSAALSELFEAIETEAVLERETGRDPAARARLFLDQIVGERDATFRAILFEIGQDERQEIAAASAALRQTRNHALLLGGLLGAAFLLAALYFAASFRSGLQRPIRQLAATAEAFGQGTTTARAPDGMPGEFKIFAARFNDMATDLSARQAALTEQVADRTTELAAANEELRQIDANRRQFFANVSHELRTPVTVLLGEAQLARRYGPDGAALAEAMTRIEATGGFLRRRLDDLMRLARSQDGSLGVNPAPIPFPEPIAEAVELARGYAMVSEVTLETDLPDTVQITADAEALRQAALALIDNAVKFSPPEGMVMISARVDADRVRFAVSDQGPGFQGDASDVLNRYAQESAGRAAGGSGLGLAIARWIAEQHGGTLHAENRPEGGATVTLDLPNMPA